MAACVSTGAWKATGRDGHSNGTANEKGEMQGHSWNGERSVKAGPPSANPSQYRHVAAVHSSPRTSCLSHDSAVAPSFLGFRNLMVIMLVVSNLRLVIENFIKYGVLICIRCHDYRPGDFLIGGLLYLLVPCHLFVAYLIEFIAAPAVPEDAGKEEEDEGGDAVVVPRLHRGEDRPGGSWRLIAFAHALNATICLGFTTAVVYGSIHHPLIGTVSELHAVIVWLKICSYALTNRDLRRARTHATPTPILPSIYSTCPYPRNITLENLSYFWWAPTLVYQPVYPRSTSFRSGFFLKRVMETIGLSMFIWIASAQYAAPLLRNSLDTMQTLKWASIAERVMKLSTISLVIWLAGFFALFHSFLNALAEVTRFGDREFYTDWWNSPSVGTYWRTWNKPVFHFMKRHVYSPLIGRGCKPKTASAMVFLLSAFLHELLVGVPTHNVLGVAFVGMILQLPLIELTLPLETMRGINGKVVGNVLFWVSFCLVGQPLAALLYFFAWQAKYGSVSRSGP